MPTTSDQFLISDKYQTKIQLKTCQIQNYNLYNTFVELHYDKLQGLEESVHDYPHKAKAGIAAPCECHHSMPSEPIHLGSRFLSTVYAEYTPPVSTVLEL